MVGSSKLRLQPRGNRAEWKETYLERELFALCSTGNCNKKIGCSHGGAKDLRPEIAVPLQLAVLAVLSEQTAYINEEERTKELIGNAAVENAISIIPSTQFPKLIFHGTLSQNNAEKVFKHFPPAMKNRSEEGCFTDLIT